MKPARLHIIFLSALLVLGACSSVSNMFKDDKKPLEGDRISVLELQKALEPDKEIEAGNFEIPQPWRNSFWPQAGGYPNHSMQNLELASGSLKRLWRTSIGEGADDELPLTAQPIVMDGLIYTMDIDLNVRAFNTENGRQIWRTNVQKDDEDELVIGGGLAAYNGLIFITNGYNEVIALNAKTGEEFWRRNIPAPSRAAPSVLDDRTFITTLDNRLIAMSALTGETLWDYTGLNESAGLLGAASPAVNRDIVLPAFTSGEMTALRVENGSVAWSDNLANIRRFGGLSSLSDIKALPVLDRKLVFGISFSGRIVAIDERTGSRIWQREIGGFNTPWVAGNYIFIISSDNELIALARETGSILWITELPRFEDPEEKETPIIWKGPVLAGGRLVMLDTLGRVFEADPTNGNIISKWSTDTDGFSLPPIVANGVLYMLSDDGTLLAYQ